MEKRDYPRLNETVYWDKLPNGLTLAIVPKQGFSRKTAYFATGMGAVHRRFRMDGKDYEAPMGVAHFLEHKLFDMPERDISGEFAALGASVNAFTSYDMTAYYFSATEHFEKCLQLLLEMVTKPYFTDETVKKEQGIIGQEIDMNMDSPETRIFENLSRAMYEKHPVREPILGTRESIACITPQVLYDCHRAGYSPQNMLLCVVTDTDPKQVRQLAQTYTACMEQPQVAFESCWQEEMTCKTPLIKDRMEVARPIFQVAFKCEPFHNGAQGVYEEFVGELAAEALFGESSTLYLKLYEEGLIDPSFGGGLDSLQDYVTLNAIGDSDDPFAVRDAILEQGARIAAQGIEDEDFLRMKRSALGSRIRALDHFDSVCFRLCAYHFTGFDYFAFPEIYEQVRPEDVQAFIARVVTPERCSLSLIEPKEENEV